MNSTIRAAAAAVACACALSLTACSGGGGGGGGGDMTVAISQQPVSATVADGAAAQFTVAAVHATGLRWQRSDDGGTTWGDIPGATQVTLQFFANYATRDAQYRAVVSGSGGEVASAAVKVNVTPVAPQVQAAPRSQSTQAGIPATFNVTFTGTQPGVTWQSSRDGTTWSDVAGATTASLTVTPPDSTASGTQYRAVATNGAGTVTSPVATLTVMPNSLSPVFVTWPSNVTVPAGGTARFDARTFAQAQGETIQWQVSADHGATWTDLPGPQFSRLTLAGVTAADDGKQFRRVASNAHDRVISGVATLTVATTAARLDLLAGQLGGLGYVDATGADARLGGGLAWPSIDSHRNVYVGSYSLLRKVDAAGAVTTVVGDNANGLGGAFIDVAAGRGSAVDMGQVSGTALAPDGTLYSADAVFNTIRKTLPDGSSSVFVGTPDQAGGSADGTGAAAKFLHPQGIALDLSGNLFVADSDNHTIRKITPGGVVTTLAGKAGVAGSGGTTTDDALFRRPLGVAVDGLGSVYVTDSGNATVRVITPIGNVNTLAGSPGLEGNDDGIGAAGRFTFPVGIAVDNGGTVFVGDMSRVRTITNGRVQTLAGATGSATAGVLGYALGLALDPAGGVVVTDGFALWRVSASGAVSALAGTGSHAGAADGTAGAAQFGAPRGVAKDSDGNLYVGDTGKNAVRKVTPAGVVTTLATGLSYPDALAFDAAGNLFVGGNCAIWRVAPGGGVTVAAGQPGTCGAVDGDAASTRLATIYALAVDASGNIFASDASGLHKITPAGASTMVLASNGTNVDGPAGTARVSTIEALAFDAAGNLLAAQPGAVRRIAPDGSVSTLAGVANLMGGIDGQGAAARLDWLNGMALDAAGNVYVSDVQLSTVRRIAPDGTVTTVLGTSNANGVVLGTSPLVNQPGGVAVLDAHHLAVLSENAVLVYTLP